jgi:hypothetical protein
MAEGTQVPCPSHCAALSEMPLMQLGAPHSVPADHSRHWPVPVQSPSRPQLATGSVGQLEWVGEMPAAIGLQRPSSPSRLQAVQAPWQASSQQ